MTKIIRTGLLLVGMLVSLPAFAGESAYDRVMRTNTIRCGYWTMPPISAKDPDTGALKGGAPALFEEIAKRLSLKVEWTEEVNFATMLAGLDSGRYDAICTGVFLSAARARAMEYTQPYMFSSVVPVVRKDETRFDGDLDRINQPDVHIAVHDSLSVALAERLFPQAQRVELPEMADPTQMFLDVGARKADVAFADLGNFRLMVPNADQLKLIHPDHPLYVFPWVLAVRKGEHTLASLLNGALEEMIYNDEVSAVMTKAGVSPQSYHYPRPELELR